MSQELEQAVKEAASEYLRDYVADKRLLLEVEIEQVMLKHLSPLFTRLSRARDKRIEELEAQAAAMRGALAYCAKELAGGLPIDHDDATWEDHAAHKISQALSGDAGKSLLAELADLREKKK